MVRKKILLPLLNICFVGQISSADDNLIIFPQRVGEISAQLGEDKLATIYGKNNLTREILLEDDGRSRCATILFRGTQRELSIFWRDDSSDYDSTPPSQAQEKCAANGHYRKPERIDITLGADRKPSAWRTVEGVFVGISLLSLEKINGAPVEFEVSESCGNGGILSWRGGSLEKSHKLFSDSRISFNPEDVEVARKRDVVSSTDLSDSVKSGMFLDRISFYLLPATE